MSEPKLSKYAQKVAKRNTLAAAFQRVEEQKREALPEQAERHEAGVREKLEKRAANSPRS